MQAPAPIWAAGSPAAPLCPCWLLCRASALRARWERPSEAGTIAGGRAGKGPQRRCQSHRGLSTEVSPRGPAHPKPTLLWARSVGPVPGTGGQSPGTATAQREPRFLATRKTVSRANLKNLTSVFSLPRGVPSSARALGPGRSHLEGQDAEAPAAVPTAHSAGHRVGPTS